MNHFEQGTYTADQMQELFEQSEYTDFNEFINNI